MAKVAFLGLGVMGYPMAGHLKNKGGHDVTVYNRSGEKSAKWAAQHGGKAAKTPKEAAEGQDFVMMCVGNDHDVREVALGASGAFAGVKKGAARRYIMRAVEDSLKRLKTDHIDLYQQHAYDPLTPIEETLRALEDLIRDGKVRYVGCSNFPAWRVVEAQLTARAISVHPFISIQDLLGV